MRRLMNCLLIVVCLGAHDLVFSDWVDGYVDEISSNVDTLDSGGDSSAPSYNQPAQLLPLHSSNHWSFVDTDVFEGVNQNLSAELGVEEDIGDFSLFFRDGPSSDVSSGIVLASNNDSINLEQEQTGSQQQLIDGDVVNFNGKQQASNIRLRII